MTKTPKKMVTRIVNALPARYRNALVKIRTREGGEEMGLVVVRLRDALITG